MFNLIAHSRVVKLQNYEESLLLGMEKVVLNGKSFDLYLSERQIQARVDALAAELNADYAGLSPLLLPILNGAFIFAADLIRALNVQPGVQFVSISTYGNDTVSSRTVQSAYGLNHLRVRGRHVLIVEDIVDTGFTVEYLRHYLNEQEAASVRVCCLLHKPDALQFGESPEYAGFEIPNEFVVGYGLDYAQQGRELRHIYRHSGD